MMGNPKIEQNHRWLAPRFQLLGPTPGPARPCAVAVLIRGRSNLARSVLCVNDVHQRPADPSC
jgi:hypothetical protein